MYLYFRKPTFMEGREVLFVPARYDGNLIARRGGKRLPNTTLALPPNGALAMQGSRYPITEIGFQTLTRRLIELLEAEQQHEDAVIEVFPDAKIDGRPSTLFRLTYHRYRPGTMFRQAYIAFDKESRMPVYFRSVAWPTDREENPVLEEYDCRQCNSTSA